MRNANLAPLTDLPSSRWQMPIHPETYLDRQPHLTEEEQVLMQQYATAPASFDWWEGQEGASPPGAV